MARPAKTITVEDVFPANPQQPTAVPSVMPNLNYMDDEDDENYDDVTALNNVLAELGASDTGGGFVNIFRVKKEPNGTKSDQYIGRFDAAEFAGGGLLESIKSQWGGGTYKIGVYLNGGRGLKTRKLIDIAPDPVTPATAQPARDLDVTPIIAAINQSNEQTLKGLAMLAQALQTKQPSRTEMLQEMQIMAEMFKGNSAPVPQYNPIEMMKMGMEMAQMSGGGENSNLWVSKMIDTFAEPMMKMIADNSAQPRIPRASAPVPAAPPATSATTPTLTVKADAPAQPTTQEDNAVNGMIVSYLSFLERAAEKRAPVDEYADSILSLVGPSNVPELETFLRRPDWREQVAQKTNVVERYPDWFVPLRDTLLQFIEEDKAAAVVTDMPVERPTDMPVEIRC